MADHPSPAVSSALAGALTGSTVGRFLVGDRLGKGAMGEVYRAEDPRLKRTVAIKRLSPSLRTDPVYRHRFLEEAERASSFTDSHIAAVYDVVEHQDEMFLVMELVEGQTLRHRLREKMTLEEFLGIAIQCAEALAAAHERGIVHCDIKPENIMLTTSGQVKILDFGVAKHLPSSDQSSTIDRSGVVGGTPAYMAPEVLLEGLPDGRADIFSLGVVLYEALTGKHPFAAGSYVATTHRVLHEKPASIRIFNSTVPEALESTVNRALAKQPADRYQSARELLTDLHFVEEATSQPGLTLPSWAPPPLWKRILGPVLATLVVVAMVAAGYQAVQRWWPKPVKPTYIAVLPFIPSSDDAQARAFSKGLSATLSLRLAQLTGHYPVQVVPPGEITNQEIQYAEQARKTFGVNVVLEGSLRQSGHLTRISYSLIDAITRQQLRGETITVATDDPFAMEDRLLESIVSQLGLALEARDKSALFAHSTTQPAAYDYYLRGRGYLQEYQKRDNVDNAIALFRDAIARDSSYALAYAGLGEAYWREYDLTQDSSLVNKASENCHRAVSLAENLAGGHVCQGVVYNGTGQYDKAVQELQRATQLEPTNDDAFRGLASAYQRLGKWDEAEQTYKRAIDLRPQYFGGYAYLGSFYFNRARYEDAARMFGDQIAVAPDNRQGYSNLGAVYLNQGRYSDAIPQFQRSVVLQPSVAGYSNLATAYFFQGNYQEAARTYQQAVKLAENSFVAWGNLAEAYYWTPGERARAADAYQKAIALANARLQVNPRDAEAISHLALFHAMLQHRAPALKYVGEALQLTPDDPETQFKAAKVYIQLGMRTQALAAAEKAISLGYLVYVLRDDPVFADLAADVQFQKLVRTK
jgi:serine/threonine protein kinase/tetratricopeptide (TPR) repeat protein